MSDQSNWKPKSAEPSRVQAHVAGPEQGMVAASGPMVALCIEDESERSTTFLTTARARELAAELTAAAREAEGKATTQKIM